MMAYDPWAVVETRRIIHNPPRTPITSRMADPSRPCQRGSGEDDMCQSLCCGQRPPGEQAVPVWVPGPEVSTLNTFPHFILTVTL